MLGQNTVDDRRSASAKATDEYRFLDHGLFCSGSNLPPGFGIDSKGHDSEPRYTDLVNWSFGSLKKDAGCHHFRTRVVDRYHARPAANRLLSVGSLTRSSRR